MNDNSGEHSDLMRFFWNPILSTNKAGIADSVRYDDQSQSRVSI